MNLEEVKEHIKEEEGYRDTIYLDSMIPPNATIGYGHLVLPRDKFKEGVKYSHKELEKVFEYDFQIAKQDMESLTKDLDIVDGAKEILIHMLIFIALHRLCWNSSARHTCHSCLSNVLRHKWKVCKLMMNRSAAGNWLALEMGHCHEPR